MRLLFDQGSPVPLRRFLHPHNVDTAGELGWSALENGELISSAEAAGHNALITTDQKLKYQQNLSERTIAIIVLKTTSWPRFKKAVDRISSQVDQIAPGDYLQIAID